MNQNALDPDLMSAGARLDKVAAILADGIRRLLRKPCRANGLGEVSLDLSAPQSVHGTPHDGEGP